MRTSDPPPLKHPLGFDEPEAPVTLYNGPLEVYSQRKRIAIGTGEIFFSWLPTPRVRFRVSDMPHLGDSVTHVRAKGLGVRSEVLVTSTSIPFGPISGLIRSASFPETAGINELRFIVPNFVMLVLGDPLASEVETDAGRREMYWAGRNVFRADGWELTLDADHDRDQAIARLRTTSRYEVTQIGRLRRVDHAAFSSAVARDAIGRLIWAFSLARGLLTPPLAVVGIDSAGDVIWQDWKPYTASPWRPVRSIVDEFHPETFQAIFEAVSQTWADPLWRDALVGATQIYTQANGSAVFLETSLVLSQAALELIAWVHFVEDTKQFTRKDFDNRDHGAAERGRALLDWLHVGRAIPSSTPALQKAAKGRGWSDGPHALDSMRNALIHPSKRGRASRVPVMARIELQELAIWYVELALLRAINFDGVYSNRLVARQRGEVERVPWSTAGKS